MAATATETRAATGVFEMVNAERAASGLAPLRASAALTSTARQHNMAMAAARRLAHQLPGEASLGTRISRAGVPWHSAAENIGYNDDHTAGGAEQLESMMYNEHAPADGHRLNILSTSMHYVGIDTYVDSTGRLWLTEDFADQAGPLPHAPIAAFNPVGRVDRVSAVPGHRIVVTGWAVDPDNRAKPLQIAVYIDNHGVGRFSGPRPRPDVARTMHAGPDQGFTVTLKPGRGRHTVCVYGVNIGHGSGNPRLGCATVIS